jgi:hypothetical protein
MIEVSAIIFICLLVGSILLGAFLLQLIVALIFLPLKLGFMLLKGVVAAVCVVPVMAVGTAVLVGLLAVGLSLGFVAFLLHLLF